MAGEELVLPGFELVQAYGSRLDRFGTSQVLVREDVLKQVIHGDVA
jgi:hypothetical protein